MNKEIGDFRDIDLNNVEEFNSKKLSNFFSKELFSLFKNIPKKEKRNYVLKFITILVIITIVNFWLESPYIFLIYWALISYILFSYSLIRSIFFREIAEKNNLQYKKSIPTNDLKGVIFQINHSGRIRNVLIGKHKERKARFFSYSYNLKSGRSSMTYSCTAMEIFFEGINFPKTLLHYRKDLYAKNHRLGKNEIKINLEQEFDKEYLLYTEEDYGIEVMQVFNKEFLDFLIKEKSDFSIELNEDRLYIYISKEITKSYQFKEFLATANEITERITPLLERLKNDFNVLNELRKD